MDFGKDLEDYPKLQSKGWLLRVKNHRFRSGDTSDDDASANVFFTNTFPFCPNWFNWFWMSMTPLYVRTLNKKYNCDHYPNSSPALQRFEVYHRPFTNRWEYVQSLKHFRNSLTHGITSRLLYFES